MLQTTNNEALNTQATKNKGNETVAASGDNIGTGSRVGRNIKNLLTVANLAKSKKKKSTMLKKSDLSNAKANFGIDFLTLRAKDAFIHL